MAYKVKYDEIDALHADFGKVLSQWNESLEQLNSKTEQLVNTTHMSGHTADNMKAYLGGVYGSIQAGVNAAIASFQSNWMIYRQDYREIDSAAHTRIDTDYLEDLDRKMSSLGSSKEYVETDVRRAVSAVSDISNAHFAGISRVHEAHRDFSAELRTLIDQVTQLESSHSAGDFAEIDQIIQSLRSLIEEMLSQKTIYKTGFSGAAYAATAAFGDLMGAYDAISTDLDAKQERVKQAASGEQVHAQELRREEEERRKQAEDAKKIALGLCIVGSIAATALTAGAASPMLVGVISGAATGAVMAGVNSGADMYAAGGWDSIKWDNVGREALIGGIKGAATGAITGAFAGGTQGLTGMGKIAADGGVKVITGIADRGMDTMLHEAFSGDGFALNEDFNLKHASSEAVSNAFNRKKILGDAVAGSTKSIVSSGLKSGFDHLNVEGHLGENDALVTGFKGVRGAITETGAGISSRFTKELAGGASLSEAWENAVNEKDLLGDVLSGSGQELGKIAAEKRAADQLKDLSKEELQKTGSSRLSQKENAALRGKAKDYATEKAKKYNDTYGKNAIDKIEERTGVTGVKRSQSGNLDYSDTGKIAVVNGRQAVVHVKLSGKDSTDIHHATEAFKQELGPGSGWKGPEGEYVWHHSGDLIVDENGDVFTEMQLVPDEIHNFYPKHAGTNKQYQYYQDELSGQYTDALKKDAAFDVTIAKKATMNNKGMLRSETDASPEAMSVPKLSFAMPVFG